MWGDFLAILGGQGVECIMKQEIQNFHVSIPLHKYNIGVQENFFIIINGTDIFHQQIN